MFLGELNEDPIDNGAQYHDKLNPKVWRGDSVDPKVRKHLLAIANKFIENLDTTIQVKDIVLTGSLANYNYTDYSDYDLHIVTDFSEEQCNELAEKFYNAKKTIWNNKHNIMIRGHEVEIYVEDVNNPPVSGGVYSLRTDKWIRKPEFDKPEFDRSQIKLKVKDLADRIERAIDPNQNSETLEKLIDKIGKLRKAGLQKSGEYGPENLAFKILRNQGILDKLRDEYNRRYDREQGLDEGIRDQLAGLALGAGVALGGASGAQAANFEKISVSPGQTLYGIARQMDTSVDAIKKANKLTSNNLKVGQTLIIPNQQTISKEKFNAINGQVKPVTGSALEKFIMQKAKSAGIRGIQLAAFLSQMSHETGGFKSFTEYGGKKYFNQYDIKYDRDKAIELGNMRPGDGYKYRGRGYVHLTGKYNYRDATKFLNRNGMPTINLVKNPEHAANPEIAALIAVWWWETRTQRKVKNWLDVRQVTKTINPSLNGLEDRQNKFKQYLAAMSEPIQTALNEKTENVVNYFAYGMLTDPRHIPGAKLIGKATLPNYEFKFARWANVIPKSGDSVEGVLWSIPENLLNSRLDKTEVVPELYIRKQLPVMHNGEKVVAWVYTMTPESIDNFKKELPERSYIKDLSTGYTKVGVDINQIRSGISKLRKEFNNTKELDEVAMNPGAYAQSMTQAAEQGVLVGLEFEVQIPKEAIEYLKNQKEILPKKPLEDLITQEKWIAAADYQRDNSPVTDMRTDVPRAWTRVPLETWSEIIKFNDQYMIDKIGSNSLIDYHKWLQVEALQDLKNYLERFKPRHKEIVLKTWNLSSEKAQSNTEASYIKFLKNNYIRLPNDLYSGLTRKVLPLANSPRNQLEWTLSRLFLNHADDIEIDVERALKELPVPAKEILKKLKDEEDYWNSRDDDYGYTSYDPKYKKAANNLSRVIQSLAGNVNVNVFDYYHEERKNLRDWYIEPDGSIDNPRGGTSCEIVTPPLAAGRAIEVVKNFVGLAKKIGLTTNDSTGLHINVSIPKNIDILKLIAFTGDNYVLELFNRQHNNYAASVLNIIKKEWDDSSAPHVNDPRIWLKRSAETATNDHSVSINAENSKYISFRHAGGDYLNNLESVVNVIGRFVRALIIASDPELYKNEYIKKLSTMINLRSDTTRQQLSPNLTWLKQRGWPVLRINSPGIREAYMLAHFYNDFKQLTGGLDRFKGSPNDRFWIPKNIDQINRLMRIANLSKEERWNRIKKQTDITDEVADKMQFNIDFWPVDYGLIKDLYADLLKHGQKSARDAAKKANKANAKVALPEEEEVQETIRKIGDDKWRLYSKDGKKNLGTFRSLEAAKKHEREVQYFKHKG